MTVYSNDSTRGIPNLLVVLSARDVSYQSGSRRTEKHGFVMVSMDDSWYRRVSGLVQGVEGDFWMIWFETGLQGYVLAHDRIVEWIRPVYQAENVRSKPDSHRGLADPTLDIVNQLVCCGSAGYTLAVLRKTLR